MSNKRLTPKKDSLIRLFSKSGNECAFEGCSNRLFNKHDNFIGQVCHINSVSPKEARFDGKLSPEDLRKKENLILLCYEHHVEIDTKTNNYTVQMVREIKAKHESKFENSLNILSEEQVENVQKSFLSQIDNKLDEILIETKKDKHLKEKIEYNIAESSIRFVPRKRIWILLSLWVLTLAILIYLNKSGLIMEIKGPLLIIFLIGVFFILAGFLPFALSPFFSVDKEVFLWGRFYKRDKKNNVAFYNKVAQCNFPSCNGQVQIWYPPEKEKSRFKVIGQCSHEPKLHTFSCEKNYQIGFYYKMDFSQKEN
eukprot:TRINITY_DN166_c0_g1_i5.p1 TRINITY_DN166_c0_g1~~TRINITY_DN166_c0_g1_i5.p1  ORF type:complete len:310 (-),score=20.91 TRINITY_DN166_c0_g1_i5:365-1294(-)